MTETTNIKTIKGKIVLAMATFFLALIAAAAVQSPALAETAPAPSASEDSIEAGTPKHKTASKSGEAVKDRDRLQGTSFTSKGTYISTSGSPGAIVWRQIVGQAYYYGAVNLLAWDGSTIYRSPSYSGTQVITETHKIYKWNRTTGSWQYWTNRTSTASVPRGYLANMAGGSFQYASSNQEHYFVDIQVTWKTTGGSVIAKRTIRTTNHSDYYCKFSRGTCSTNGTEGSLVWISLYS